MTDHPTPPPSAPTEPVPRPKRTRTILGRLAQAVRDGNGNRPRDDELRTAITAYADAMEHITDHQGHVLEDWNEAMDVVSAQVDGAEFAEEARRVFGRDIMPDSVFSMMVPEGVRRQPFAFDRDAFLASSKVNRAVFEVLMQVSNIEGIRAQWPSGRWRSAS